MYYNQDLKIFNYRKMNFLKCGGCSEIYYYNGIVFKKYFDNCKQKYRLSEDMFNILKDINNSHFIELIDIFRKFSLLKIFSKDKLIDACTAKFYLADDTNILYEKIDYLLENFRELDILFDLFSNNGIETDDVKFLNTVINKDGIIIIDPDLFFKSDEKNLSIKNKGNLLNLCSNICRKSLSNENNYEIINANITHELTNFKVDEKTDVAYELSKKLKGYKRPIDYLNKQ